MKYLSYIFILSIAFTLNTFAQAELDTSFGGSGAFVINGSPRGGVDTFVIQPDNKIITAGDCINIDAQAFPVCLFRLTPDGNGDATFGGGDGIVYTGIPGFDRNESYLSHAIEMLDGGKFVVLASATVSDEYQTFLIRYNSDGSVDTEFGNNGLQMLNIDRSITGFEMLVQRDQKILVTGTTEIRELFITRYSSDGTPDTTFADNGLFKLSSKGFTFSGYTIALQNDGKLYFSGARRDENGSDGVLGRLNSNGIYDSSFGENGIKIFENIGVISKLKIQGNNKLVVYGGGNKIYRLMSDGSIDTTFGEDGSISFFGSTVADRTDDIAVTPSGRITVIGHQLPRFDSIQIDYLIARFRNDGSPDTTFSEDGLFDLNINGDDVPSTVRIDRNDKAVIAGFSASRTIVRFEHPRFSIARLADSPIQSVEFSGRITDTNRKVLRRTNLILKDGSNVVGYARTNPFGYFRFNNIQSGKTYTISINTKGKTFEDQEILIDDNLLNYNLIAY